MNLVIVPVFLPINRAIRTMFNRNMGGYVERGSNFAFRARRWGIDIEIRADTGYSSATPQGYSILSSPEGN